ncbi:MAG: hypothetical protein K9K67_13370 [Bacteriovoracaceae bacterium]|nr:hypothetical protein [Bacteriovoracaceae bacterium]
MREFKKLLFSFVGCLLLYGLIFQHTDEKHVVSKNDRLTPLESKPEHMVIEAGQVDLIEHPLMEKESIELPVKAILYAFEGSGDLSLINNFMAQVKQENNEAREQWIESMPSPKNTIQELLLYALSTHRFESYTLGGFEEALTDVGTSLDQIEGFRVNEYLDELIERSRDLNDTDMLVASYQYNASHSVDYEIGKKFVHDIEDVIDGKLIIEDFGLSIMFKALLADQQISYKDKFLFGNGLLPRFQDHAIKQKMNALLEVQVSPMIANHTI